MFIIVCLVFPAFLALHDFLLHPKKLSRLTGCRSCGFIFVYGELRSWERNLSKRDAHNSWNARLQLKKGIMERYLPFMGENGDMAQLGGRTGR